MDRTGKACHPTQADTSTPPTRGGKSIATTQERCEKAPSWNPNGPSQPSGLKILFGGFDDLARHDGARRTSHLGLLCVCVFVCLSTGGVSKFSGLFVCVEAVSII